MAKKAVINLSKKEAEKFFFQSASYSNIDLPEYFNFEKFLRQIQKYKIGFDILKAKNDLTSHIIYTNKDGKYAWRKLQFIHPILYIELARVIIDNWSLIQKHFNDNKVDRICACPIYKKEKSHKKHNKTQILAYLEEVEKASILESINYKYLAKLDIAECYPSVYTHAIAWALHGKSEAKQNRTHHYTVQKVKKIPLYGNDIDFLLQSIQEGQTNGIPQGSILMDFIAEIILTHIDKLLGDKLKSMMIYKYKIIRYRDDYRIFTQEKDDSEKIIKLLSEILMDFNFKLNAGKTEVGEDIVLLSLKKDKLENIIYHVGRDEEIDVFKLKRLLLDILSISKKHQNSGFILRMLQYFNQRKFYSKDKNWYKNEVGLLITILINIALGNPRCFSVICISIFNLLQKLNKKSKRYYLDIVYNKLSNISNIGFNEIWLQRCIFKLDNKKQFSDRVCSVVSMLEKNSIFGNHFVTDPGLKDVLNKNDFIDRTKLSKISKIPKENEVNIFDNYNSL